MPAAPHSNKRPICPRFPGTLTFKYDPFGRRIEKTSPTATSIFAYDGDNLVETVNAGGGVVARYAQGLNIDEPLAMLRGATTDYYEADGLGSVTSLTDTTGALAETYTYDSFGNTVATSGTRRNYFQYTGREFDTETSLYYYRARYYDPLRGTFLSEDPIRFVSGVNFYAYTENSPINFSDVFGLCDSANDARRILNSARNSVNNMILDGERIEGGNLNNLISTFRHLNPFGPTPYKGCGAQTNKVIQQIIPLLPSLSCPWDTQQHYEFLTSQHILPHQWVSYSTGSGATSTVIQIDPWNNQYQILGPGQSLSPSGWKPLVPGIGNALHPTTSCCGQ